MCLADEIQESWDRQAATWKQWEPVLEPGLRKATDAMLEALGDVQGKRVLDLACGTGPTTRALTQAGADAIGMDLSKGMLQLAHGGKFQHGDLDAFEGQWDAITCRFGAFFSKDPMAWLARCKQSTSHLTFAIWGEPPEVPMVAGATALAYQMLGIEPPLGPGPFQWSPHKWAGAMEEVGFTVHSKLVDCAVDFGSAEAYRDFARGMSGDEAMAGFGKDKVEAFWQELPNRMPADGMLHNMAIVFSARA